MRAAILIFLLSAASYAGNPFQSVRGELPQKTASGAHTGSLAWGTARADARLQQFGDTWTLAVRPPLTAPCSALAIASWPTTSLNVRGLYFLAKARCVIRSPKAATTIVPGADGARNDRSSASVRCGELVRE